MYALCLRFIALNALVSPLIIEKVAQARSKTYAIFISLALAKV